MAGQGRRPLDGGAGAVGAEPGSAWLMQLLIHGRAWSDETVRGVAPWASHWLLSLHRVPFRSPPNATQPQPSPPILHIRDSGYSCSRRVGPCLFCCCASACYALTPASVCSASLAALAAPSPPVSLALLHYSLSSGTR